MVLETWEPGPIQWPKKKLKSKQNQKSYQHFHHFTIPVIWQDIYMVNSRSNNRNNLWNHEQFKPKFHRFKQSGHYYKLIRLASYYNYEGRELHLWLVILP